MNNYRALLKNNKRLYKILLPLLISLISNAFFTICYAQDCPANIDFENATFSGWTCYTGGVSAVGSNNVISLSASGGPLSGRHEMFSSANAGVDYYGGFPELCPNGSGHSIKLGNSSGGAEAEGVSYEFTIPANQNSYTLIYNYAVVFQSPNHRDNEQPRMEIEISNVTDNTVISCASFTFIAMGTSLPGFQVSNQSDTTAVLYKDWSAVSVDLSGNAGKTIKLFFKTADCTFRRHFGYAYIDVNSECSGTFVGATYCPDDTLINVTAPYGYQGYTWFDSSQSRILGSQQVLTLTPPPPSGTVLAVKLDPYNGYGCPNTLYTTLRDSLTVIAHAGRDSLSCNLSPIQIGTIAKAGLVYSWAPAAGLSNPNIANPLAAPFVSTNYVVTTTNSGGGCRSEDSVFIRASIIEDSLQVIGKPAYCIDNGDSAILKVEPTSSIQWFKDGAVITGNTNQTSYRVTTSGTYHAFLKNSAGCTLTTKKQAIIIDKAKPGIRYPVAYAVINFPLVIKARPIGETVLWQPPTSLNNPLSFTPTFKGITEQLYTINIKTKTECLTVDTQLVKTIEKVELYLPTAFTPNGDGRNDYLHPLLKGIKEIRYFRIFNRWGQLLYETKNEEPGWDGTFKGSPLESQAVVWLIEGVGVDEIIYSRKGSTLLLR